MRYRASRCAARGASAAKPCRSETPRSESTYFFARCQRNRDDARIQSYFTPTSSPFRPVRQRRNICTSQTTIWHVASHVCLRTASITLPRHRHKTEMRYATPPLFAAASLRMPRARYMARYAEALSPRCHRLMPAPCRCQLPAPAGLLPLR